VNNPLTDEERRDWNDRAMRILEVRHVAPHDDYLVVTCRRARRYEDTLQAKDAQIEALVAALRAYMVWEPATVVEADYRTVMYRAAEAAIKEATT